MKKLLGVILMVCAVSFLSVGLVGCTKDTPAKKDATPAKDAKDTPAKDAKDTPVKDAKDAPAKDAKDVVKDKK